MAGNADQVKMPLIGTCYGWIIYIFGKSMAGTGSKAEFSKIS